ncbi:hypothetical protein [Achromobacter xylosoxidans]|uniref:hypothetical protein n=1 Tax=Alcaligenes xylosoxydans xylosoxydans TaxID=85698 RepID=UPI0003D67109|nr:hypothetical protein [Achromobacter xylosoxidans]AHC45801.1 hypothetical protein AX27061_1336 [Achromobacter xylosoxidans NBRC 15126 = ATCC 27061]QKQ56062.1 hypothetical protein FOC83_25295 [Achromobacter xylosoxidans]QPR94783.1 hypothetical protein I6G72_30120 [Achromobacter xylosoxidans]UON38723.1 hypothetical protein IUJ48_21230 [Achromobacter xylosoxidans]CKH01512.1 Uncharacterised protein [Achromobacter xylosoxidans]
MPIRSCRALGAGAMALALLAGCNKKTEYPPEVQRTTYNSCMQGFKAKAPAAARDVDAKAKDYCQCVLDGLQAKVPLEDFLRYDQLLASGAAHAEAELRGGRVMTVVNACLERMPRS